MRDSDPTVRLTQLGIAPRDAKGLVQTLRQDVARMSNDLLPDVAYSAAPGSLLGGWRVISEVVTEAVREDMKRPLGLPATGLPAAKEDARFAAVPVIAFDPVAGEWIRHAKRRKLGSAMGTRPDPGFGLLRYRETSQQDNALDPRLASRVSNAFYQAIATGIAELGSRAKAAEWTGWALLAIMMALDTHMYHLPVPDGDYLAADDAYHKGMALLVGGGLNLISEGERLAGEQ